MVVPHNNAIPLATCGLRILAYCHSRFMWAHPILLFVSRTYSDAGAGDLFILMRQSINAIKNSIRKKKKSYNKVRLVTRPYF